MTPERLFDRRRPFQSRCGIRHPHLVAPPGRSSTSPSATSSPVHSVSSMRRSRAPVSVALIDSSDTGIPVRIISLRTSDSAEKKPSACPCVSAGTTQPGPLDSATRRQLWTAARDQAGGASSAGSRRPGRARDFRPPSTTSGAGWDYRSGRMRPHVAESGERDGDPLHRRRDAGRRRPRGRSRTGDAPPAYGPDDARARRPGPRGHRRVCRCWRHSLPAWPRRGRGGGPSTPATSNVV